MIRTDNPINKGFSLKLLEKMNGLELVIGQCNLLLNQDQNWILQELLVWQIK